MFVQTVILNGYILICKDIPVTRQILRVLHSSVCGPTPLIAAPPSGWGDSDVFLTDMNMPLHPAGAAEWNRDAAATAAAAAVGGHITAALVTVIRSWRQNSHVPWSRNKYEVLLS